MNDREKYEESERRFRIMADTAPVLLWMAESNGLCNYFNQRWLDFTGRTMEEEVGNGWAEGIHPEDFQSCMSIFLDSFVARREFKMEYRLRRADGKYRWILDNGIPRYSREEGGTFVGYIGSCVDITEQKELRDELEIRVQERTAELESFTGAVSHDLRSSLRNIDRFARGLLTSEQDKNQDKSVSEALNRILVNTERMNHFINALLGLSRIGKADLHFCEIDLSSMVENILSELCHAQLKRKVQVIVQKNMKIFGDSRLIRILFENLLNNSWKFTSNREETTIEVGQEKNGADQNVYFVRDNGTGFDMRHAVNLFKPFFRLHRHDEFPGTGVGLSTVYRILKRHRGKIWAESKVDEGTTFYMTFQSE